MPKLKRISGDEVVSAPARFGFSIHSQRGSHVKLRRTSGSGAVQTLTMPWHRELDAETLLAIFRQASRFVPEHELRREFYAD